MNKCKSGLTLYFSYVFPSTLPCGKLVENSYALRKYFAPSVFHHRPQAYYGDRCGKVEKLLSNIYKQITYRYDNNCLFVENI